MRRQYSHVSKEFVMNLVLLVIQQKKNVLLVQNTIMCRVAWMHSNGSSSPPVHISTIFSHFYSDQLHVLNTTSNGRKYSTSILSKPQRFPTKPIAQIDAIHYQTLCHLLRRPPPPRLHLRFRPDHHHHRPIYTRFLSFLKKKER